MWGSFQNSFEQFVYKTTFAVLLLSYNAAWDNPFGKLFTDM